MISKVRLESQPLEYLIYKYMHKIYIILLYTKYIIINDMIYDIYPNNDTHTHKPGVLAEQS